MKIFHGFDDLPAFRNPVVTVGSYDGVHCGHRQLLGLITSLARERDGESIIITFSPHPRQVLEGYSTNLKLLNSLEEKTMLLESAGIDNLLVAPFTREFSRVSSYDFVREYLIGKVGVATLVTGYNHHFGFEKEGNFGYLDKLKSEFGFEVRMVGQYDVGEHKVSSTVIRNMIEEGRMAEAARLLGYHYFIIGRISDDTTTVITDEPAKLLPSEGEYAVWSDTAGTKADNTLRVSVGGSLSLLYPAPTSPGGKIIVTFR